ncbi:hypothetical protein NP233_g11770 [Leucocoprinus birnbaumii]|uniref:BTB domain-containing protein n=1 Tax=Leucocoprinus birnbaumii TaxID=56174 RepID=A0AAD5YL12_9AGAR|nr:hypothetical protein NP233_g11770 [Leucocoprinus birnbaumii]
MHRRDEKYYFDADPMVIFLVEGRLFRVHRHFLLRESKVFRDMLNAPPVNAGQLPLGSSDERAIPLLDVTATEFAALVEHFYTPPHLAEAAQRARNYSYYLDLLSVCDRFHFDDIYNFALDKIRPDLGLILVMQRLQLGEKYRIPVWQSSALDELASRRDLLTAEEAEMLGVKRILEYTRRREAMLQKRLNKAECLFETLAEI